MHNIGGKGLLTDFGLRVASCLGHEQDEVILRQTDSFLSFKSSRCSTANSQFMWFYFFRCVQWFAESHPLVIQDSY